MKTTGLSGNEIYCIDLMGYKAGDLVVGNSVHSMGFLRSIASGFRTMIGGEITQITDLIEEGRATAINRMEKEGADRGGVGITGVTSELIFHESNIEFLSIGSCLHGKDAQGGGGTPLFSTSSDGQTLFAQMDAGYQPIKFVFGNVAYSIGIASGILGTLKTLARGEIKEFSDIFNTTRHLALQRIEKEAVKHGANSVVGINTIILPTGINGIKEMLMLGTASINPLLPVGAVATSDLTPQEMWNLNKIGYVPQKLLIGTSVFSLGILGNVTSFLKSFTKGEIPELSSLIYEARENALGIINDQANSIGADEVVGVRTRIYQLGNGLIEFMAIGTAVKKNSEAANKSDQLPPQTFTSDYDTFVDVSERSFGVNLNIR